MDYILFTPTWIMLQLLPETLVPCNNNVAAVGNANGIILFASVHQCWALIPLVATSLLRVYALSVKDNIQY